jgi:type II secretion system protein I
VRSAPQAGFTLIEVLVALAILSIAVVASIQGFAQGLRLLKLSGDHQHAMLLADQKVREVVELKEGRDAGTEGWLRWERTMRPLEIQQLPPPGGTPPGRMWEIDVRVLWDAQRQVELRTLRLAPPPNTVQVTTPGSPTTPSGAPAPGGAANPFGTAPGSTSSGRPSTTSPFGGGRTVK